MLNSLVLDCTSAKDSGWIDVGAFSQISVQTVTSDGTVTIYGSNQPDVYDGNIGSAPENPASQQLHQSATSEIYVVSTPIRRIKVARTGGTAATKVYLLAKE